MLNLKYLYCVMLTVGVTAAMDGDIIKLPEATIRYLFYPNTAIYDSKGSLGKYLIATKNLSKGTVVAKFEGPVTFDSNNRHSKWIGKDNKGENIFIIVESSAVYMNHSCDPNCEMDSNSTVKTIKDVKKNEALTISYNRKEDFPSDLKWDKKWDFDCHCGTGKCPRRITGWKD